MQTTHFSCRLENQDLLSSPLTLPLKFYYLTEEEEYVLSQLVSTTQKGVIPMSQVIAIVNQKGGVAKTTTTVNLAAALVQQDERTLCDDLDPQANLTMSLGCQNLDELPYTIADVIDKVIAEKNIDPSEGIIHHAEGIDLMPSSIQLSGYDTLLINEYGRENMLRQYVDAARPFYDHILIDCQPSLNILTINALVAADSVLIPTQPQFFSAKGLELLFQTYSKVRRKMNPDLKIEGVLVTMMDKRPNFTKDVVDLIRSTYGRNVKVFDSEIPMSVRAIECGAEGKSIFAYDPKGNVAEAYANLAQEVIENTKREQRRAHKLQAVR